MLILWTIKVDSTVLVKGFKVQGRLAHTVGASSIRPWLWKTLLHQAFAYIFTLSRESGGLLMSKLMYCMINIYGR